MTNLTKRIAGVAALASLLAIAPCLGQSPVNVLDGKLGVGTDTPTALLTVEADDETARVLVEEKGTDSGNDLMLQLKSAQGAPIIEYDSNFGTWFFSAGFFFAITNPAGPGNEFTVSPFGDLTVSGDIFSSTCNPDPCAPDYVFSEDYELLPLDELDRYIDENRHLPGVPSADDLVGPINVSKLQMTLLEKLEELTLYVLEQHRVNREQEATISSLQREVEAMRSTE